MKKTVLLIATLSLLACSSEEDTITIVDKTGIVMKNSYTAQDSVLGKCTFIRKGDYVVVTFTKDGKEYEVVYDYKEVEQVSSEVNK